MKWAVATLAAVFGGPGVFMLWASQVVPPLAVQGVLFLLIAVVVVWTGREV